MIMAPSCVAEETIRHKRGEGEGYCTLSCLFLFVMASFLQRRFGISNDFNSYIMNILFTFLA